jgi:hypothetical protein
LKLAKLKLASPVGKHLSLTFRLPKSTPRLPSLTYKYPLKEESPYPWHSSTFADCAAML